MITERSFAASFHDFWRRLLPLLTPSCVHLLNVGHEEHLLDQNGDVLSPVALHEQTRDSAVVSEFAYHLAKEAFSQSSTVQDIFNNIDKRNVVQRYALNLVHMYESESNFFNASLNSTELQEGLELALRYEAFVGQVGNVEECIFEIPVQGAGFLHACNADMVLGDYLVEVKTVNRSLAAKDIRQLIIYLALRTASHKVLWHHAGFFNPRRATYHKFITTELIRLISGGKTAIDICMELIDFACSSDVQFDSVF